MYTIIGIAVIPLDTVYNSPKIEIDDWYPLTESADMSEEATGRVHVILTYYNDSDLVQTSNIYIYIINIHTWPRYNIILILFIYHDNICE